MTSEVFCMKTKRPIINLPGKKRELYQLKLCSHINRGGKPIPGISISSTDYKGCKEAGPFLSFFLNNLLQVILVMQPGQ